MYGFGNDKHAIGKLTVRPYIDNGIGVEIGFHHRGVKRSIYFRPCKPGHRGGDKRKNANGQ